jgi:hypothetical protein
MTEVITIARLNNLQSRIALILGNGAGDRGYGQPVTSSQIANSSNPVVRAQDINRIFLDLVKARIHQVGFTEYLSSNLRIAEVLQNTSSVGLESSPNVVINPQTGQVSLVDDVQGNINISSFRGISDYERLIGQIEIDKFLAHPSQMSIESATQSIRITPWNKELFFEFVVNFKNSNHRRHFFNAGGKLNINSSLLNVATLKSQDWSAFLSSVGTVSFSHNQTTGANTGTLIGNYGLTPAYQVVYQKVGGGTVYGLYSGNLFTVRAKEVSPSSIAFKVEFSDVAVDGNVDDVVQGRLECVVNHLTPDGFFDLNGTSTPSVVLDAPTYSTLVGLDSFAAPTQIFSLTSNKQSITEGESFRVTLNTINVADSTQIPYTITGVSSEDINQQPLSSSFVINRNTSSKTFTVPVEIPNDKVFQLKLNSLPNTVRVNFNKIPTPTSANRTCISVIDESSIGSNGPSASTLRNSWLGFRSRWPNRPFFLLQPGRTKTELRIPREFDQDPLAKYAQVNRDNGVISQRSDWYAICNLASLPDGSKIAIFIDTSGSMDFKTVQASYDFLIQQLNERNMNIITVSNPDENWVLPFDQILD